MGIIRLFIIFAGGLGFSALAQAQAPSGLSPFTAETAPQHITDCSTAESFVPRYCSQNPALVNAQAAAGNANIPNQTNPGAGQTVTATQGVMNQARSQTRVVQSACQAAFDLCNNFCTNEANQAYGSNPPDMPTGDQRISIRQRCVQENTTLQSQAAGLQADISQILEGLAMLAQALGLGQGNSGMGIGASGEEPEDKCEGEYAHLLIECKEQSGPSSSRAGLSGIAALNGKTSNGLGNLFDGADGGEPGGEDKGVGNEGGAGGNPFGAAGLGNSGGLGGTNAANVGGDGSSGDGLDTDINKGFLGTGGGFGGGGGGGGSRGGGGRGFSAIPPVGGSADGMNKASLQKKLNKYANDSARNPASVGGANGPFESNWAIIKKAYKKNSGSMFHQQ